MSQPNSPPGFRPPGYAGPPGPPGPPGAAPYGAGPMVSPHAPFGVDPRTGYPYSDKSKIIAAVLQFAFGVFGAGRFYTGHTGLAIAQLCVVWFTCGMGALWPLIDGIMMLTGSVTDANGLPLRD